MNSHTILISGDTSIDEIRSLLVDLLPGDPVATEYGLSWANGSRFIGDADLTGDYYDDDLGLPLSQYRFEVATKSADSDAWTIQVYNRLRSTTELSLLWLQNMQQVIRERTLITV